MKKLFVIFAALAMVMSACSQQEKTRAELRKVAIEMNKRCPVPMGILGDIQSFDYDNSDNMLEMKFNFDPEMVDSSVYESPAERKQAVLNSFHMLPDKTFLKLLDEAGAGIRMIGLLNDNPDLKLEITHKEIADLLKHPLSDREAAQMLLETNVLAVAKQTPVDAGDGTFLVDVYEDGDDVVFVYEIDDANYGETANEIMNGGSDFLKQIMVYLFSDPSMKSQGMIFTNLGKNFKYIYRLKSTGQSVEATLTSDEIASLIK